MHELNVEGLCGGGGNHRNIMTVQSRQLVHAINYPGNNSLECQPPPARGSVHSQFSILR